LGIGVRHAEQLSVPISLLEKQRLATELATNFDENRLLNALATEMATDENW
jgi:hypothetical protein